MKITKSFLKEVFGETMREFNQKIAKIDHIVELSFIEKDEFLSSVKSDPLIQQQIVLGIYKNIEKEYPNFLVVYNKDKNPMLKILGISYKISLCFEMAKDILKPYDKRDVKAYLKQLFSHELTHIIEDDLLKSENLLWEKCLKQSHRSIPHAKELFAESVSQTLVDKKAYEKVFNSVWSLVNNRVKKMQNNLF